MSGLAAAVALMLALAIMRCDAAILSSVAQWDARAPVSRVKRSDGMVALTFDSGWGEDYTLKVLEILEAHGTQATFFLTGYWMDENPDKARAIADQGHELGGHSVTHSRMVGMESGAMDAEILGVSERISALTGAAPRCFRPPYGDWDLNLLRSVRDRGQIAVTWSVDAQSTMGGGDLSAALGTVRAGDIVLMNLCDAALVDELDGAVEALIDRGLTPCTVSALAGADGGRFVSARGAGLRA